MVKEIHHNGKIVGQATVKREGLYYRIACCCNPEIKTHYKMILHTSGKQIDLGTCLYDSFSYRIDTSLPIKQADENMCFELIDKRSQETCFIPIVPNEPFPQLDILIKSTLTNRNGIIGITYPESS